MAKESCLIYIFLCVYFHIHFRVTFFCLLSGVLSKHFNERVQSNSWGICRNTVITLQLVQILVPLARSLGARMGKAFGLSVATPCVWTSILLFLKIQNSCVTGSTCVGFNPQREVVVICYQNLVLFLGREYLFVSLEKGVCLCFSPDWDEGNTFVQFVRIEQGAMLPPMASSGCAHFRAQCGTFSCLKS